MKNLKTILADIGTRELDAGGAISARAITSLKAYRKQQLIFFVVMEVVIVGGIAFCAYFISRHPGEGALVKAMISAVGLGAGGGIEIMRRTWKEWSRTDLLLTLISDASEAQVRSIIDKLIKGL